MDLDEQKPRPVDAKQGAPLPAQILFRGRREIEIEFQGEIYRLRITRNQKLILTK